MTISDRIRKLAENRCDAIYPNRGYTCNSAFRSGFKDGATDEVLIKAIRLEERAQVAKDAWSLTPSEFFWEMHEEALAELEQLIREHEA